MRFSIIIMTYKKFDNLSENLHSIRIQDFQDYEILISDDGSDSYDEDFIKKCLIKEGLSERVTLIHHAQNIGTVKNYNSAVRNAKGEIMVPLSQDDRFADEKVLRDLDLFFRHEKAEVCYCKRRSLEGEIYPIPTEFDLLGEEDLNGIYYRLLFRNYIYGATLYFKKSIWEKIGGFDERFRLLEDHPFAIKVLSNGVRIAPFDRISIIYGKEGISSTKIVHSKAAQELIKDNVRLYDEIISKAISSRSWRVRRAYRYRWQVSFYCHVDPNRAKLRKLITYLRFIDVAIPHKLCHLKYGKEADVVFVNRLYSFKENAT